MIEIQINITILKSIFQQVKSQIVKSFQSNRKQNPKFC